MSKKLLLVDLENKQKVDLSRLDESYRAIIFVGANQSPPKASKKAGTAHRFTRVDFLKISGSGKNALDFHIAFELGRIFETAPQTACIILSGDKGFDPLLNYLTSNGMDCRRVESLDALVPLIICRHCQKSETVPHHGGHWCSNCGRFAVQPDPALLPSNQFGYREPKSAAYEDGSIRAVCGWCNQRTDMAGGIYDDGEWMCGSCINIHST